MTPMELMLRKLAWIMDLKNNRRGRIKEYADEFDGVSFHENEKPWSIKVDVALPCATQNELNEEHAKQLVDNGCIAVAKGPICLYTEAIALFNQESFIFTW